MIDGSDNNDISVTIATTQVVPESVAEFQVQTNAYSVEFGRNSGAQVNVITKSGHQRLPRRVLGLLPHQQPGLAHQHREGERPRRSPPDYTRHQAGASIGGPIIKDKTFFFAALPVRRRRPGGQRRARRSGSRRRPASPRSPDVPLRAGQSAASRAGGARPALVPERRLRAEPGVPQPARTRSSTACRSRPARPTSTSCTPSTYHTFNGARRPPAGATTTTSPCATTCNKRKDENAISNCDVRRDSSAAART